MFTSLLGATLAEWQKKREEEEAARRAAMRNSGGGGEEENDAADKKRMKVLARVNPAYARALAKEQSLRAEIAKVTAQELKGTNISVAQAQARQQAQWDANGQAIYKANQSFKELDATTKEQAIKAATTNGVFSVGLYSANLNTAQAKLEKAAEEQRKAEQAAMQEAQRKAEAERQALIAKNEDKAPVDMDKVKQLVQQSVDAKRWAGVASVAQAKQESKENTTGGGKPLAMPVQNNLVNWFDRQINSLRDALFSSGDEPPTFLDRLYGSSEWNQARDSVTIALDARQLQLINESGWKSEDYYYYTQDFLGLGRWNSQMNVNQFQSLENYIDEGQVPWNDTLNQVNTLQEYFGYDNRTMVTALRELYYEDALDFFIANAKPVKSSIYEVSGDQNGITSSEASFSRTMLILTKQGHGYTQAVVQVQYPEGYDTDGEFAFDHIIGALDANFNPVQPGEVTLGFQGNTYGSIIGLERSKIESLSAVTYIGDLAGSTGVAFQYSDAPTGYRIEMSQSDLEGDILGVVLAKNNVINPNGNNLAQELSDALSANSPYVTNTYTKFANIVGLEYSPQTGEISPSSAQAFTDQNRDLVSDLGAGFYVSQPPKINIPGRLWNGGTAYLNQSSLNSYAETQIASFLEQINQGLQGEFGQ